ncbi:MAG: hypothetical protein NTW66_01080 [Candidatus Magasanikbacteria bacterium]|nr:hypothetical protein [Candidatus Magasanikbacteria bacterium]
MVKERLNLVVYFSRNRAKMLIFAVLLSTFFIFSDLAEAIPNAVNYQGRLRDNSGTPIAASTTIQFSIYNHLTNGSPIDVPSQSGSLLWTETYDQGSGACAQILPDPQGYFTLTLGDCVSFPSYLDFSSGSYYLGVKISTDAEASPRVKLNSHPYALNSDRVDGFHATSTATPNQLLALGNDLSFNIGTGSYSGAGINLSSSTATSSISGNLSVIGNSTFATTTITNLILINPLTLTDFTFSNATGTNLSLANLTVTGTSTLGIINGGTWQGGIISPAYGGTGQDTSGWNGFIKLSGGVWGTSTINLVSDVSGTLPIINGGTNASSFSPYEFLWFDGTSLVASGFTSSSFLSTSTDLWVDITGDTMTGALIVNNNLNVSGTSTLASTTISHLAIGDSGYIADEVLLSTYKQYNSLPADSFLPAHVYSIDLNTTADSSSTINSMLTLTTNQNSTGNFDLIGGTMTQVVHQGTGAVSGAFGSVSSVELESPTGSISFAFGMRGQVMNGSNDPTYSGSIGVAVGLSGYVENGIGGGTITNATALLSDINIEAGTIINAAGLRINNATSNSGTGTISNLYGLYIEEQTLGSDTNFNIYSAGTNSINYFAGNIGIGTTSPEHRLHIVDSENSIMQMMIQNTASGTTAGAALVVQSGNASGGLLMPSENFEYDSGYTNLAGYLTLTAEDNSNGIAMVATGGNKNIIFYTGGLNSSEPYPSTERMRVASTGQVSIGTSSTYELFTVAGGINIGATTTPTSTAGTIAWNGVDFIGYTGSVWVSLTSGSGTPAVPGIAGSGNTGEVTFWSNSSTIAGSSSLYWDNTNGFFGIGTYSPAYKLHISEDTDSILQTVVQNIANGTSTGAATIFEAGTSRGAVMMLGDNFEFGAGNTNLGGYLTLQALYDSNGIALVATGGSRNITFYTGGAGDPDPSTERMRIETNGNVAIGTSSTYERLTVAGGINIGATTTLSDTSGTIAFNGTDFIGYTGTEWLSLTATGTYFGGMNLQQVTDNGNVTTNSIQFAGGTSTAAFYLLNNLSVNGTSTLSTSTISRLIVGGGFPTEMPSDLNFNFASYKQYNHLSNTGSGLEIGNILGMDLNPDEDASTTLNAMFNVTTNESNSRNFDALAGIINQIQHRGSGTVGMAFGQMSTVDLETPTGSIWYALGLQGGVQNGINDASYAGVINNAVGLSGNIENGIGGGTIVNAAAINSSINIEAGTIGEAYGMRINNPTSGSSSGTIGKLYGLYIQEQNFATTSNYNIYSDGANSLNYFGGRMAIGTTSTYELLTVNGGINIGATTSPTSTAGTIAFNGLDFIGYNGSTWLSLTSGTGISGSGSAGQIAFWNASSTITGSSSLYWDNTNNYLGIGTSAPAEAIDVNGNIQISAGNYLKYNGVNLAYGSTTLMNYFFGDAGTSTMITSRNIGIGNLALRSNYNGYNNMAIGAEALRDNTSGSDNMAIGYSAMQFNTTGIQNTAIGTSALSGNIDGADNVAIGYGTLPLVVNTSGNTAIGFQAGQIFVGSNGLFLGIGADTLASASSSDNAIAIGKDAKVGGSNMMVLGGTGADAVSVGIGTSTPYERLTVVGAINIGATTTASSAAGTISWNGNDFIGYTGSEWLSLTATGTGSGFLNLQQVTDNGNITTNSIQFAGGTSTYDFLPGSTSAYSLGSSSSRWLDFWANNVYIGSSTWGLSQAGNGSFTLSQVGGSEMLRVLTNGNIGVNTTTPAAKMDIYVASGQNVSALALNIEDASSVSDVLTINNIGTGNEISVSNNGYNYLRTSASSSDPFGFSGAGLFIYDQAGNPTIALERVAVPMMGTVSVVGMRQGNSDIGAAFFLANTSSEDVVIFSTFEGIKLGSNNIQDTAAGLYISVVSPTGTRFSVEGSTGNIYTRGNYRMEGNDFTQENNSEHNTVLTVKNSTTSDFGAGPVITLENDITQHRIFAVSGGDSGMPNSMFVQQRGAQGNLVLASATGNIMFMNGDLGSLNTLGYFSPSGTLTVSGAITLGATTTATSVTGTIAWNGSDFIGFNGSNWLSLTAGGGAWTEASGKLYPTASSSVRVLIGGATDDTTSALQIAGNVAVSGTLNSSGMITAPCFSVDGINCMSTNDNGTELFDSSSDFNSSLRSMDVSGNFLYTITYESLTDPVLRIVDITNPTVPEVINSGPIANFPNGAVGGGGKGIDLQGNYAYVTLHSTTTANCLRIVDIKNPKTPYVTGGQNLDISPYSQCNAIDVSGRYAYILTLGGGGLIIVDIADPYNPRVVNSTSLTWSANAGWSVKYYNGYLYILSRNETSNYDHFRIYDVSDPTNPFIVGGSSIDTGEGGWSMDISGDHLYMASGGSFTTSTSTDKLVIINISDPTNAYKEGGMHLTDSAANFIKVYGTTAILSSWDGSIYQANVASSTNPILISSFWTGSGHLPLTFAAVHNYLYVGFADIPYTSTTLKTYSLPGVNLLTGNFGSLTAGKLYIKDEIVADKRLRVLDSISVGDGGLYTTGALIVSSTSSPSYFGGSVGVGTSSIYEMLTVGGAVNIGATTTAISTAGTITWDGSDFVGYTGSQWLSFTAGGASSTIMGSGSAGQLAFWNGATSITGSSSLYWNNTNGYLGVGVSAPSHALDVKGDINITTGSILKLNNVNLAYGDTALANYFFGNAGNTGMSGSSNVAAGSDTFKNNTTGFSNSAFGNSALTNNTTGFGNNAIGNAALSGNTTGTNNNAQGNSALTSNTSGSYNTAVGTNALRSNSTGNSNAAFGFYSLYSALGSGNVGIGNYAGFYENGSNSLYIDNQDRGSSSGDKANALIYGIFSATAAGQSITFNVGNASFGAGNITTTGGLTAGTGVLTSYLSVGTTSTHEKLTVAGGINIGATTTPTSTAGTIAFNGTDFIGYTGSQWLSLTATGTSSISGSGASGQLAYWNSTSSIAGTTSLYWDSVNSRLGIGTTTPSQRLDLVDGSGSGAIRIGNTGTGINGSMRFSTTTGDFEGYDGGAWRSLTNLASLRSEATGFPNRTDTSLSFATSTRTFTITGTNFRVYSGGSAITKSTGSVSIPNITGSYYFYYTSTGVLTSSTVAWTIASPNIPIATVYWNQNTLTGELGDERHGLTMDGLTHQYLHFTIGTRYESGLAGTFSNATGSVSSGAIWDEDVRHDISTATQFQVFFHDGATNYRFTGSQSAYYLTSGGGTLFYDNGTGTSTVSSGNYVAYWIFATNDPLTPIVSLMGQRQDTSIGNARTNNTFDTLALGNLPYAEMKVLYRVILRNIGGTVSFQETQDLRNSANIPNGSYLATAHSSLSGLSYDLSGHTGFAGTGVDNLFSATNTFSGYSYFTGLSTLSTTTISHLTVDNLSGLLRATAGVISTGTVNLASGLDITGVLAMANGGTNRNMTALAGAIAYSDADSLELTATGTAGQLLVSNGSGAPSWISTSSLGLIGSDIGGFTPGSIIFVSSSGKLAQDNSNFFWDDLNNRLGIGTTTPGYNLHVVHNEDYNGPLTTFENLNNGASSTELLQFKIGNYTGGIGIAGENFSDYGLTNLAGYTVLVSTVSPGTQGNGIALLAGSSGNIMFYTGGYGPATMDTERMRIENNGDVAIGTSSTYERLTVAGGINIGATTTPTSTAGTIAFNGTDFIGYNGSQWLSLTATGTATGTGNVYGSGSAGQLAYWDTGSSITGSSSLYWDETNGNLGIGTSTPSFPLHIVQNNDLWALNVIQNSNTGPSSTAGMRMQVGDYGGYLVAGSQNFADYGLSNLAGYMILMSGGPDVQADGLAIAATGPTGNIIFYAGTGYGPPTANTERMRVESNWHGLLRLHRFTVAVFHIRWCK